MAKKVKAVITLQLPAGKATPAPPVGPALGQHGINMMAFLKEYNERTAGQAGMVIPALITIYEDRSFSFVTKTPPAADLIKKAAGVEKGSGTAGRTTTGMIARAKFDESVELHIRTGVDPRHADQQVRGSAVLPAGTGRTVRVVAFATGDKAREAGAAGAEVVGPDDLVQRIQGGWTDFDVAVGTPDLMGLVGRLGKILGPRGLMPNPRSGTVTPDVGRAIREIKGGRVEFRVDRTGIVHAGIGKASFDEGKLLENARAFIEAIQRARPTGAKGTYVKKVSVSSSMGPGVKVDIASLAAGA